MGRALRLAWQGELQSNLTDPGAGYPVLRKTFYRMGLVSEAASYKCCVMFGLDVEDVEFVV